MKDGLNQEIINITRFEKRGRKLIAWADDWKDTNGMKMPIKCGSIWAEHKRLIKRAGYKVKFEASNGLDIPVMITQTRGQSGVYRRVSHVWGKHDGHIYSISKGEGLRHHDLIFPIMNDPGHYQILDVRIKNGTPPYTQVELTVDLGTSTREYMLDRTKDYIVVRKKDIAPTNAKQVIF